MSRHLIMLMSTSILVAACAPTEPRTLVRAEPTEPPSLEVAIAPAAIPAFKPQLSLVHFRRLRREHGDPSTFN